MVIMADNGPPRFSPVGELRAEALRRVALGGFTPLQGGIDALTRRERIDAWGCARFTVRLPTEEERERGQDAGIGPLNIEGPVVPEFDMLDLWADHAVGLFHDPPPEEPGQYRALIVAYTDGPYDPEYFHGGYIPVGIQKLT